MKVTIFGSGYVGLVTGACLAEVGHHVICVDVDQAKIDALNAGKIPIFEPGLEAIIAETMAAGNLSFTTDAAAAVAHGVIQLIAVGTPPDEDGSADLQYVLAVAETIAEHMTDYKLIATKSTVPVGTAAKVSTTVQTTLATHNKTLDYDVASNPEFLKEGAAVDDFTKPDRIIVGTDSNQAETLMRELYAPFNRNRDRIIVMDIASAELTKYAANAMLAAKISFMNEIANIAERVGADIESVRVGIGSDPRIGYHFIYPGCGYGGSCFPKDVKALERTARDINFDAKVLQAIEARNQAQKHILFDKIKHYFDAELSDKTIAVWGLAFKPNTDDLREAPSRVLIEALWQAGAKVRAFDPVAMEECQRIYGQRDDLVFCSSPYLAIEDADALAICTEWKNFRSPDFEELKRQLKQPVIFDGRNLYDLDRMCTLGFDYYGIGRSSSGQLR